MPFFSCPEKDGNAESAECRLCLALEEGRQARFSRPQEDEKGEERKRRNGRRQGDILSCRETVLRDRAGCLYSGICGAGVRAGNMDVVLPRLYRRCAQGNVRSGAPAELLAVEVFSVFCGSCTQEGMAAAFSR